MKIEKMHTKLKYIFLLAFIILMGCEKQIELDLPSVGSKLVVDGWLTSEPGEGGAERLHTVRLTQSISYFETQNYPVVKDAQVILKDDKGQAYPLTYTLPMVYDPNVGKEVADEQKGRYEIRKNLEQNTSYTLYIKTTDGIEYESTAQMVIDYPYAPKIFVEYKEADDFSDEDEGYYINFEPKYSDEGNFYFCWQLFKLESYTDWSDPENPIKVSYTFPYSDLLFGSNVYTSVEESETQFDQAAQKGEQYFIKQHVVARGVYDFLRLAEEQRDNEGTQFSPPPAPLRSNIKRIGGNTLDDDALGFFIISSVQKTEVTSIN
ncbi:DUF4249 domain-containing protein [Ancylomarina euxinus]|uniref:DUF4249 domain-containing protein n=1 Tax=Ancylomarina euxinus TaxID=2283627 RepID=A0A425Y3Q5_9BACT|nr:DUF4249 domain-containing protein [Ancylomarina euxinus]MCZ4693090.1 DUF4249 domain-containing protein [Ancylomarina euxinus]MUP15226.1 DUF4249 family protein [Ancylomarina euxinus]RRG22644.1 DUF4249 domain-containing protein [Ancylomarina euxinus]